MQWGCGKIPEEGTIVYDVEFPPEGSDGDQGGGSGGGYGGGDGGMGGGGNVTAAPGGGGDGSGQFCVTFFVFRNSFILRREAKPKFARYFSNFSLLFWSFLLN